MPDPARPNDFGLTQFGSWSDLVASPPLADQLEQHHVAYEEHQIHNLAGMGGNAYLVFYTSPKTGKPVTVLCCPERSDIDQFGEAYYYFEGMSRAEGLGADWLDLYDKCVALTAAT